MFSCIKIPDSVKLITENNSTFMEKKGTNFIAADTKLTVEEQNESLYLSFTAMNSEVRFIMCRWNGRINTGSRFMGDSLERGYGNLEWHGMNRERIMPWYFIISENKVNHGYGVKVKPDAFCFWMCDPDGISLWMDLRCGASGVILRGKEIHVEVVEASSDERNAFQLTKVLCKVMSDTPIFPEEPVYGSNNWYYAYGKSSDRQILKDTELVAELAEGLNNRPYMVIDDCWQELADVFRAAGRPYNKGNDRFPDMPGLADEINKLNVKPGIWFRPLRSHDRNVNERLIHQINKEILDPTVPEALDMIVEDTKRISSWGYQLLKYDFVTKDLFGRYFDESLPLLKDKGWHFHDRSVTSAQCIKRLYSALKEAAGEKILIGCNVIGHLASGYIHIHRSGDDTSGYSFDRSVMMGVNTLAFRLPQHKAFYHIDADCVGITDKISWKDNRKILDLFANSGTPLFISADPVCVTDEMKQEIREAFIKASIQSSIMEPLDWMDTTLPQRYLVDGEEQYFCWTKESGPDGFTSRI